MARDICSAGAVEAVRAILKVDPDKRADLRWTISAAVQLGNKSCLYTGKLGYVKLAATMCYLRSLEVSNTVLIQSVLCQCPGAMAGALLTQSLAVQRDIDWQRLCRELLNIEYNKPVWVTTKEKDSCGKAIPESLDSNSPAFQPALDVLVTKLKGRAEVVSSFLQKCIGARQPSLHQVVAHAVTPSDPV